MNDTGSSRIIRAFWFSSNNFGDNINSFIINNLSGKKVCLSQTKDHFIICGSILSSANEYSTVWGAGFYYEHHNKYNVHPDSVVKCVRGDLSANRIGRDVVAIGDPVLLLPKILPEYIDAPKKHQIGLIPHWSNIEHCAELYPGVFIINPLMPVHTFIQNVTSCEYVFSESLHGLIVSDAYGIPNAWIKMGADVGDDFKYHDYYSTTIYPNTTPISELNIFGCTIHKYKYSLETLLKSCPFLK